MKKVLKIGCFSGLGFIVLIVIIGILINAFVPEEELEEASRQVKQQEQERVEAEKRAVQQKIEQEKEETPVNPATPIAKPLPLHTFKGQIVEITPPEPKTEFDTINETLYRFETTDQIIKAYIANPFKADAQFKGKTIKVLGEIAKLENMGGIPYVYLAGLSNYHKTPHLVSCQLKRMQPVLEKLSKDESVWVIGVVEEFNGLSVKMADCLVSIPKTDIQKMPFVERLEKADYWIDANVIAKEYKDNSETAYAKYFGKIIVIKGVIRNVMTRLKTPTIVLDVSEGSAWCAVPPFAIPILEGKTGKEVFVVGKLQGKPRGLWHLEDCLVGEKR